LISGSSRGLGRALAEAVLASGDKLVASARRTAPLADLEKKFGDQVRIVALDVTDEAAANAAIESVVEEFGRIDVLVNNAGYGDLGSIEDTSLAAFRAQMRKQRAGHIIQISSVGGRIGALGRAPYSAAKWGVEGFSEVLAKEVGPLGIKVTIVEPGGFRTDFAGSSTTIHESRPEYDGTVGAAVRFQRDYNGRQPGDPAKAAAAIIHVAGLDEPPLRLLLGSDAFRLVEQNDTARLAADQKWRELSISTDFGKGQGT
jgi:NAD(P)-dependent dehydrogenase (short-subunit alcohol dehydrogenase family)